MKASSYIPKHKTPTKLILFALASLLAYVCWPQDDFVRRIIQVSVFISIVALTVTFCLLTLASVVKPLIDNIVQRVADELERRAGANVDTKDIRGQQH